jgi:hypothetical protein
MKKPVKDGVGIAKQLDVYSLVDGFYTLGALPTEKIVAINIEGKTVAQERIGEAGGLFEEVRIIAVVKLKRVVFKRQAVNGENHCQQVKDETQYQRISAVKNGLYIACSHLGVCQFQCECEKSTISYHSLIMIRVNKYFTSRLEVVMG